LIPSGAVVIYSKIRKNVDTTGAASNRNGGAEQLAEMLAASS
jgi:hypothetical protein